MRTILSTVGAIGLGALAMYYLDPKQGRQRRAETRDKAYAVSNTLQEAAQSALDEVSHRSQSVAAEAHSWYDKARSQAHAAGPRLAEARDSVAHAMHTPRGKAATAATGIGVGVLGVLSRSVLSRYPLLALALGIVGYAALSKRDLDLDTVEDAASEAWDKGKEFARPVLDAVEPKAGTLLQ